MANTFLLFMAGYLVLSFYYLIRSAYPSESCVENKHKHFEQQQRYHCAKPLFSSFVHSSVDQSQGSHSRTKINYNSNSNSNSNRKKNVQLLLELWTQYDGNSSVNTKHPHLTWRLSPTCPPILIELSQAKIFQKLKLIGGKGNNCTVEFPAFSRVREEEEEVNGHSYQNATNTLHKIKLMPWKAKFVLKYINGSESVDSGVILAQAIFDLTRIVSRKNGKMPYFKYYKQPVVIRLVLDDELYPVDSPLRGDGLVLQLQKHQISPSNHIAMYHLPTFYVDDVALKHSSHVQLAPPMDVPPKNETKSSAAKIASSASPPPTGLSIQLSIISPLRHVFHRQLYVGFHFLENVLNADELDEIRHMISDEYMYRFLLTQIISMIHIYLDYIAFRDEVMFYVGKKNMGGISFSSVLGRFICQFIIFLYLCDGGNTSWLVLASIGSGVLVELWKVLKFMRLKVTPTTFPFVTFQTTDSMIMSQLERDTVNYDAVSRTYLCMLLYPLVMGSAIYAKRFYVYSTWWSWLISNLANAVYTFGFIALCPQLYVNFKLKSVAHLPWKVFMYKIFNTFVDDVFAFMIQMPLKHKLMTLRDDFVFIIFLVQAYMYRVDKSRINEFGYAYNDNVAVDGLIASSQEQQHQEVKRNQNVTLEEQIERTRKKQHHIKVE